MRVLQLNGKVVIPDILDKRMKSTTGTRRVLDDKPYVYRVATRKVEARTERGDLRRCVSAS